MKNIITISARDLVEFIFKKGSINNLFQGISSRSQEGISVHKKIQNSYLKEDFSKEVSLSHEIEYEDFTLKISGRADGIWKSLLGYKIEEIKSTSCPLDKIDESFYHVHLAQAKVYAYIFSKQENLNEIDVKLTYYNIIDEETKILEFNFSIEELSDFFNDLINKYLKWVNLSISWLKTRNEKLKKLEFPYKEYRKGQRDFAIRVYKSIKEAKNIYCEAPTGIGKTISTIFPSLKAMSENLCDRIFYLTSKNMTSKVAEDALLKINKKSNNIRFIKIIAKEKICPLEKCSCNPDDCRFAVNYYDKINDIIFEIISNHTNLTRELIEEYSNKYIICPFELTLDLSNHADFIICDYNYLFDIRVYLKRFFENITERYVFLIDECHNLIDRARDMYSCEIRKKDVLEIKKILKYISPKAITSLNKKLIEYKKLCLEENYFIFESDEKEFYHIIMDTTLNIEGILQEMKPSLEKEILLNFYFNLLNFSRIYEIYDKNYYITYCSDFSDGFVFKLYCMDPSNYIKKCFKRGISSVLFSATLIPLDYHMELLGKNEEDIFLKLPSPFPVENREIIVCSNIDTRYERRNLYIEKISDYINSIAALKEGNYIAFFPSYEYMNSIYNDFTSRYSDFNTIIQIQNQDEKAREDFLNFFKNNPTKTHIGFCVLGGMFSEGIDLKGDRLIGTIVVGVGIPKINLERNMMRDFFQDKNSKGYLYAYVYPGVIKIFQASGRVIRTSNDKGIIVFIGERYTHSNYKKLFPSHFKPYSIVYKNEDLIKKIDKFWNSQQN